MDDLQKVHCIHKPVNKECVASEGSGFKSPPPFTEDPQCNIDECESYFFPLYPFSKISTREERLESACTVFFASFLN